MDGYQYRCNATNGVSPDASTAPAILTVATRPTVAVGLTDVIVFGAKGDYSSNELLRVDKNGNQLWQGTVPVSSFAPGGETVDRNLKEDAIYVVNTDGNGNSAGYGILKFDRYGNLEWQRAISSQSTKISANPVDGGIYAANGDGVTKIDASGKTVWGPVNWGYTGLSYLAADVTTGGFYVVSQNDGGKVIKADANGSKIWEKDVSEALSIRSNPIDGGVYVLSSQSWYAYGAYYYQRDITRLDNAGNIVWRRSGVPSNYNYGMAVDPLDGSLIIGSGWPFVMEKFGMNGQAIATNYNYGDFQIAPEIETGGFYGSSSSGGLTRA